jgi:hypothetical protein
MISAQFVGGVFGSQQSNGSAFAALPSPNMLRRLSLATESYYMVQITTESYYMVQIIVPCSSFLLANENLRTLGKS